MRCLRASDARVGSGAFPLSPDDVARADGIVVATGTSMNKLDAQPGATPQIRLAAGELTYVVQPRGVPTSEALVIRCEPNGEILVSIVSSSHRSVDR